MPASTHTLTFDGAMTWRGFWLYVCRIATSDEVELLYVGMNGDRSSGRASSPFERIGQHLGHNKNNNAIRKRLRDEHGIEPETCATFEMVAYGPFSQEVDDDSEHKVQWSKVDALEKALANSLRCGGYKLLNKAVNSNQCLDPDLWNEVRTVFAVHFGHICRASDHSECQRGLVLD